MTKPIQSPGPQHPSPGWLPTRECGTVSGKLLSWSGTKEGPEMTLCLACRRGGECLAKQHGFGPIDRQCDLRPEDG
jgi:hypothetical protein